MPTGTNDYLESFAKVSIKQTLRKYGWLLELARKHRIQVMLLQGITSFLDRITNVRKEGDQLDIGLIFRNDWLELEQSPIKVKHFHIQDLQGFADLKNIVNGHIFCYVVDSEGMVRIARIPSKISKNASNSTLKNASKVYQTLAFYVRDSIIEIFDAGKLVRVCRNGIWMKPCSIPLQELSEKGYPSKLLEKVLDLSMKMSDYQKGGIFVIMKSGLLKHCYSMIKGYTFERCGINQIPESQIIKFADLDGAIVLNTKNEILGIAQKLEPPPMRDSHRESGRGTKHHSAANYSNAEDCVVFVISEDGPISVYFEGRLFARCFDELFSPA